MAWQVFDFMHPGGYTYRGRKLHGPLPRKRWVPSASDPKPRRVKSTDPRSELTKREFNEQQAIKYAKWLAARDGIEIPHVGYGGRVIFRWSSVDLPGKTKRQRFWNGTREVQASEPRIMAVEWCRAREVFNTRKDGKRGAYQYTDQVPLLRIEIPHWDHVPTLTVETCPGDLLEEASAA